MSTPRHSPPAAPPIITLPLVDKTEFPVTADQVAQWRELYPAVDVEQQLRNMRGWLIANPTRRKTRRGVLRFVNTWLADKQNRAGPNGNEHAPALSPPKQFKTREQRMAELRIIEEKVKREQLHVAT